METSFRRNTDVRSSSIAEYVSSGIPSIDFFLGGGLSLNTLTVLGEDENNVYALLLLKSLISSNLHKNHRVILVKSSGSEDVECLTKKLPSPTKMTFENMPSLTAEAMKIAWRYSALPKTRGEVPKDDVEVYDFGHPLSAESYQKLSQNIQVWTLEECMSNLKKLSDAQTTVVILPGIASATSSSREEQLVNLVYKFKSASRCVKKLAVLVTIQPSLISTVTKNHLYNISDSAFELHTFPDNKSVYTDYVGLFRFVKLPKAKSLGYLVETETLEIGMQLKKHSRFLTVDKLSLPPDLGDTPTRNVCGSANKLDF